jgi:hypothetical protein
MTDPTLPTGWTRYEWEHGIDYDYKGRTVFGVKEAEHGRPTCVYTGGVPGTPDELRKWADIVEADIKRRGWDDPDASREPSLQRYREAVETVLIAYSHSNPNLIENMRERIAVELAK